MECLSVCQAAFLSFSFCSFSVTVYQFVNMQCWYYNPAYWDHRLKLECKWYQSLVVALVLLWLDYGNATLAGLPACLLNRLQSVLNAAARSIAGLRSSSLGAHYRCSRQFSLAPRTRAHQVQTGGHCLPGSSRHCTSVLSDRLQYVADLPTRCRGRLSSSTSSLLDVRLIKACHCRRSLFCCCWPTTLEQSTWRCPVCPISHSISSETENSIYFGNHTQMLCSCVALVVL